MKVSKKNSSIFNVLLALLCAIGTLSNGIVVKATSHHVEISFPFDGWYANWGNQTGKPALITIDGETAFCIEPGHIVHVGSNNEISFSNIIVNNQPISLEMQKRLTYIKYFGYDINPTEDNYVLTQNLIWDELGGREDGGHYLHPTKYPTPKSMEAWKKTVLDKVNQMEVKPSFDGQTISLNQNESITLTDTNHILDQYTVSASKGLTLSKTNDQLTITAGSEADENATIHLKQNIMSSSMGVLFAVKNIGTDSQAVSTLKLTNYASASLRINVKHYGSLNIVKQDNEGNHVSNTSFRISYNADMSNPIGTYTTGNDGSVTIQDLLPQTVYIQEISVPEGLVLDPSIKSVMIQSNETVTYTQTNTIGKGSIIAIKQDAETGSAPQGEATLQGAIYELAVAEDIIHPSTGEVVLKSGTIIGQRTTVSNGSMNPWENLYAGKYMLYETKEPTGYQKDTARYEISVTTGHQANVIVRQTVTDRVIKGSIKVFKKDEDSGKTVTDAPATFELLNWNDEVIQTATTGTDGSVTFSNLPYGHYSVREKRAPEKYILNDDTVLEFFINENGEVEEGTISNRPVKGSITLTKEFDETETGMTGDATLEGVTYELYAHKDILDPADGSVLYAKDSLIPNTTKKTDVNGQITWTDLHLGSYNVHEVLSNGTVVVNTVDVTADLEYKDHNTPNVSVSVTHKDKPNEQAYSLIKIGTDGSNGEVPALEGAEFTAKLKSDVDEMGWDHAPAYDVSTTDSKGYLESQRLPYGVYIVKETKVPDEHYKVDDFIVTITEDSDEPQPWIIMNDAPFEGMLKLVKKDAETGKTVLLPNTTFKIKNLDTNEYLTQFVWFPLPHTVDTWSTTDQGIVYLNDVIMYGNYQLEEITAPNGYVLNDEPVKFTVSEDGVYEVGEDGQTPVITVEMEDISVKGQITVYKEGEVFTGIHQNDDGSYSFDYESKGQSDTEFQIIADADIMDPSNDGTILYEKDETVETITTGTNGYATSSKLPLGEYRIEEIKVQNGMVLNTEIQRVKLEYEKQSVEVVSEKISFKNDRQKVSIELTKKDDEGNLLSGAIYGLCTKTDLVLDSIILLPADTLIEKAVTDENGRLTFKADLPISLDDEIHYYVKEIEAPYGFLLSDEVFNIDTHFKEQINAVISNSFEAINTLDTGHLKFSKIGEVFTHTLPWQSSAGTGQMPQFNEEFLSDAQITIYAAEDIILGGHVYYEKDEAIQVLKDSWESVCSKELPVGKYYYIETKSPLGYISNTEKHEFEIKTTHTTIPYEIHSVLKNDLPDYDIVFTKLLEENNALDEKAYEDVLYAIYTRNYIYDHKGNAVIEPDTLITTLGIDEKGQFLHIPRLPFGNYYLKEINTHPAYILDEKEYDFSIDPSSEETVKVLINQGEPIVNELKQFHFQITKIHAQTFQKILSDTIKFTLYDDVECKNKVMDILPDEEGRIEMDLPYGTWYLKESQAPEGYLLSDKIVKIVIGEEGVFVDDTLLKQDDSYAISFANMPIPSKSAETGDISRFSYVLLCIISCFLFILLKKKYEDAY